MSESASRSTRKRRKPTKPSRHSPNSQQDSTSAGNPLTSPENAKSTTAEDLNTNDEIISGSESSANMTTSSTSSLDFLSKIVASQHDIDSYMSEKRSRMMSPNGGNEEGSESRSESPQDSLDLSIGSRSGSQTSPSNSMTANSLGAAASALAPTTITSQSPRLTSSTSHNLRSSSKQTTAALKQTQKTITTIPPVVPPLAPPVISPHLGSNSAATTPVIEQQQQPDSSIMTQYEELKSKAMTSRARRIIANARERNRVHTISSAFEQLRKSIPCYSGNQKLSKLAILKIATSYIRCLSHVAAMDPGAMTTAPHTKTPTPIPGNDPKLSELVMRCTVNVLSDGKLKRPEISGVDGGDRNGISDGEEDMD
ncbi:uncharacterized protein LOC142340043 [Convolutriloba macropyga]|uniref:uncharacterized protein LOC142340043 n=1 Tax=Convolutriloba macropyga TaxID=536237 RepID=UPI003F51B672